MPSVINRIHPDITASDQNARQNVLRSTAPVGWIVKFRAEISTVVDSVAITYTAHPILISISSYDYLCCWQNGRHAETVDECELMGVRADAGPDIPASCAGWGEPAFCQLAAGGHQPHINSCIWHSLRDLLHLTAEAS